MKLETLIKMGSLAFNVAQDEKVRQLIKIAHHGVKRRGLFAPPPHPEVPPARVPFAPYHHTQWRSGRW